MGMPRSARNNDATQAGPVDGNVIPGWPPVYRRRSETSPPKPRQRRHDEMVVVKFRLLGPVEVLVGDQLLNLAGKQRDVLASLLIDAGQPIPLHELALRVWELPPPAANSALYAHLSRIRRTLTADGVSLTRTSRGYAIHVPPDWVDVFQFRRLIEEGRKPGIEDQRCAALLKQALDLWAATPLTGMSSIWAAGIRESLEQQRIIAATLWAKAQTRLGMPESVVTELAFLLARQPLVEPLAAALMRALHACGRSAEALEWFARTRAHLIEELGTEPGPELRDLHMAVLRGNPVTAREHESIVIRRRSTAVPAQLPAYATDFTGRGECLRELDELVSGTGARTIVICGTAGVGKTTLAVHWGQISKERFPDGQLYVNLHGFSGFEPMKPAQALTRFLRAFGVPPGEVSADVDEAAALFRSLLVDKKVLLLLDNAASADQVRPLLPGAADCLVLITSRNRLSRLVARDGARRISLDVLAMDDAVALLGKLLGIRGASETQAICDLAQACARLPLALRIAAASIADRPHQSLADFVRALADGDLLEALSVTDDQQAAVRTAFDVSYQALPSETKRVFCMIGAIPGPDFTIEAIAALADVEAARAGQILDQLTAMHMIEQVSSRRYTLHDLLRLYAEKQCKAHVTEAERLAGLGRLCRYYLAMTDAGARQVSPQLFRLEVASALEHQGQSAFAHPREALEWLDSERENLVAVTQVAERERLHPLAWLLADTLRGYLTLRQNKPDWLAIAESGLAAAVDAGDKAGQAAAHHNLAQAYRILSRFEQAFDHLTRARTLSKEGGWSDGHTAALCNLGILYAHQGRMHEAVEHYSQALEANRKAQKLGGIAVNLGNLAEAYRHMDELSKAIELTNEALSLYAQIDAISGCGIALVNLGGMHMELGDTELALSYVERGLAIHRKIGGLFQIAEGLSELSRVHCAADRPDEAVSAAKSALEINETEGDRSLEADARNALAAALAASGHLKDAMKQYERARTMSAAAGALYFETVALIGLARLFTATGDTEQAVALAQEALKNALRAGYRGLERKALAVAGSWDVQSASGAPVQLAGALAAPAAART